MLRIPVASSAAFATYGADWVQLDAPRHLYLYTAKSLEYLARAAGFALFKVVDDSSAFQFWASEQYRQDIALRDPRSYGVNPTRSMFTAQQIDAFTRHADELNASGQGDQAGFDLRACA